MKYSCNFLSTNYKIMAQSKPITITRMFDVPLDRVWKAWTDPKEMKKWWGPKGFTAPTVEIDFKIGGVYLNCMRSPEGQDFWSTGVYSEIMPMEKLVMTDSFADEKGTPVPASHYGMKGDWPADSKITVTFEKYDNGNKTKMALTHEGIPPSEQKDCEQGWNESFDKLMESLK
jgi:uncharacterized protein YndB with AHSA1/START domain